MYTYFAAIRLTPNAIVTVVTATKPSGITDTAKLQCTKLVNMHIEINMH